MFMFYDKNLLVELVFTVLRVNFCDCSSYEEKSYLHVVNEVSSKNCGWTILEQWLKRWISSARQKPWRRKRERLEDPVRMGIGDGILLANYEEDIIPIWLKKKKERHEYCCIENFVSTTLKKWTCDPGNSDDPPSVISLIEWNLIANGFTNCEIFLNFHGVKKMDFFHSCSKEILSTWRCARQSDKSTRKSVSF